MKILIALLALIPSLAFGQLSSSDLITSRQLGHTPDAITNLAAGTALALGTNYYDTFSADRTFTITGTPAEGNQITVYATMSADVVITFPSVKRLLEPAAAAEAVFFPPGFHIIRLIYRNAAWWLVDSATPLSNTAATTAPAVTNDLDEGYGVGSFWLDTTADNSYICLDNANGAAVWAKVDTDGTETVTFTNKTINNASNTIQTSTEVQAAANTLTASEQYGKMFTCSTTSETDLAAVAVGMSIGFSTESTAVLTIDPNGTEVIYLNGTALGAGVTIVSSGTAGDAASFYYRGAGQWTVIASGFTAGS